jgi:ketosteroid isomerase-like protein
MKKVVVALCLIAPLGLLSSGQTAKTEQTSVKQTLIQLKREIGQAYVRRDVAALDRIYADDYTVTDDRGDTPAKAQELERMKSGDVIYEATSYDDVKVRVYGDTAIVAGRGTLKGRNRNGVFHTQYFSTNVFVKQRGQWRAVAAHISGVTRL